jgi:hypothetical protein
MWHKMRNFALIECQHRQQQHIQQQHDNNLDQVKMMMMSTTFHEMTNVFHRQQQSAILFVIF